MAIRNAAKAIIIKDGKIFLNKYQVEEGNIYYELPGGGQLQYETMEEAVIRECLEETGYCVKVLRFAAIVEEMFDDEERRKSYPDYVHRIHHIFQVELTDEPRVVQSEPDKNQVDNVWISIDDVANLRLIPRPLRQNLKEILTSQNPVYLGVVHEYNLKSIH